jgi:mono/diheme cytochrome c family protein
MKASSLLVLLWLLSALLVSCAANASLDPSPADTPEARPTAPPEYAGKTNPLAPESGAGLEDLPGQPLYQANCSSCHGLSGRGDGVAARSLEPKPQDLTQPGLSDDYLFWRIAEGGAFEPFRSAMPAWKSLLKEEQIWQIIAYLRALQD